MRYIIANPDAITVLGIQRASIGKANLIGEARTVQARYAAMGIPTCITDATGRARYPTDPGVFTIPCAPLTGEPGPAILWEDIPDGTPLGGLAPIGIPWSGKKYRGKRVAEKPCPNGEFLVTHCMIDGVRVEVVP